MGSALLKVWCTNKKNKFFIIDPLNYKKNNYLNKKNVIFYSSINNFKSINLIDIIIFAVKPQVLEAVLKEFNKLEFNKKTIFLSIVAGKKINFFNKFLPKKNKFIRVMPNMPSMIGQGMTCMVPNTYITPSDKKLIDNFFLKVGKTLWLNNETQINKVTAISGSGPGYIFLIIDAFEKASMQLGLNKKDTKDLVHQTFLGSINLFLSQKIDASVLANNVAVKGGTTEAGLKEFQNNKILHKVFKKAIKSAYLRANKIGKQY